jgi:hypothetical protein
MIKSAAAVLLGVVVWFVVATIGNWMIRASLPGYAEVEAAMTFTLPMLIARLVLGLVSSLCAGAACAAIVGRSKAVGVLAALMVLLFLPVHYGLWDRFPLWYHAFFIFSLAPAVIAGAALTRKRVMRSAKARRPAT